MKKTEVWKPSKEVNNVLEVSNLGNVRRTNDKEPKYTRLKYGYDTVKVSVNGKKKNYSVHRLVAFEFIENTHDKPFINHINGIKNDNRVENLEWCTPLENSRHAIEMGLIKKGEDHHWFGHKRKAMLGRKGLKHPRSMPVGTYDDEMNLVSIFQSQNLASIELNCKQPKISTCIKSKNKHKGFYWKTHCRNNGYLFKWFSEKSCVSA